MSVNTGGHGFLSTEEMTARKYEVAVGFLNFLRATLGEKG
jgi:hypothetical protein